MPICAGGRQIANRGHKEAEHNLTGMACNARRGRARRTLTQRDLVLVAVHAARMLIGCSRTPGLEDGPQLALIRAVPSPLLILIRLHARGHRAVHPGRCPGRDAARAGPLLLGGPPWDEVKGDGGRARVAALRRLRAGALALGAAAHALVGAALLVGAAVARGVGGLRLGARHCGRRLDVLRHRCEPGPPRAEGREAVCGIVQRCAVACICRQQCFAHSSGQEAVWLAVLICLTSHPLHCDDLLS